VNDDVKSVMRVVGCLPTTLGTGLVLLGTFYWLNEWRFAGAFLFMGLVWGLMFVGLGLVIMSTARVWMSVLGSVAASSSALLIALDARGPYFNDSYYWVYAGDGVAISLGAAMTYVALRRRARAVVVARQD
jgi:hypothetical protein